MNPAPVTVILPPLTTVSGVTDEILIMGDLHMYDWLYGALQVHVSGAVHEPLFQHVLALLAGTSKQTGASHFVPDQPILHVHVFGAVHCPLPEHTLGSSICRV